MRHVLGDMLGDMLEDMLGDQRCHMQLEPHPRMIVQAPRREPRDIRLADSGSYHYTAPRQAYVQ